MVDVGCISLLLCAGLAGALLAFASGRAYCRSDAPVAAGALDALSQQPAASQTENDRLQRRVQTLEEQLRTVLGDGCIITVAVRKPR